MAPPEDITPEAAQRAFYEHLVHKARAARRAYESHIGAETIRRMLGDSRIVRYPTTLLFDATALRPYEFGHAHQLGFHPADGFALFIHPRFRDRANALPLLVAYHIPAVNYGGIIDAEGAELFGAALLGMHPDTYYHAVCALADELDA